MTDSPRGALLQRYQALWQLTRQQAEAIDAGETERLAELIVQRQAIMDEIDELQRRFPHALRAGAPPDQDGSLDYDTSLRHDASREPGLTLQQLPDLLEQISALNEENTRKLEGRLDELRDQIALVRLGRQGMKSYEAMPDYDAKFIDRRQ